MNCLRKTCRDLAIGLAVFATVGWSCAAPTPAASVVTNTATGSYVDSTSGLSFRLTSNTVSTVIQTLEALTLTGTQNVNRSPSSPFELSHQLTNTGNTTTVFFLNFSVLGDGFKPASLRIVQDTNGNGVVDAGEPTLADGSSLTLAAGAVANLLLTGSFPTSAVNGQSSQIRLTATSQGQKITANNIDTLTVVSGPAIAVTQNVSTDRVVAGSNFTLSFKAVNTGNGPAGAAAIVVNGVAGQFFILRSGLPANTTFAGISTSGNGAQSLYHRLGDPVSSYVTVPPEFRFIDAVAWTLPALTGSEAPVASGILLGVVSLRVNDNASGAITNTGFATYRNSGVETNQSSNLVQLSLPDRPPTIVFYATDAYNLPMKQSPVGAPVFVQVNAAQCNVNPSVVETHPVTLVSQLTGDAETFTATETAPNSGIFRILPRVPTANGATQVVASGNGILEVLVNDGVTASLTGCGSSTVTTTLLIDPSGTVFDSKTNAPVAGVKVRLVDVSGAGNGGRPGGLAVVFDADGVTPASASVTTGIDGGYAFPFVSASQYMLQVTTPNGHTFPSILPLSVLPSNRLINATGSYGKTFPVTAAGGAVMIDVPVDAGPVNGLFVQKTASKSIAEIGDFLNYSVKVSNNTGILIKSAVVHDRLPVGFAYIPGSARLDGQSIADPAGGAGPTLDFGIGNIAPSMQPVLAYRVRIGAGADGGDGVNTAQVSSGITQSNMSSVKVQVTGGVFSSKAYLIGKVFADCNANRLQDPGERGIPGVRLYLENGTFAITDTEGKYSLYGLEPRTHVVKVDRTSLPQGTSLQIMDNRNAGDAGSRFVDVKNGELQKADFSVTTCTSGLNEQINSRRTAQGGQADELDEAVRAPIALRPTVAGDLKSLPAAGVLGKTNQVPATRGVSGGNANLSDDTLPLRTHGKLSIPLSVDASTTYPVTIQPLVSLESLLPTLTPQLGFVDLSEGLVLPADQIRVRVKGPRGAKLQLSVNGQIVPDKQVGEQSSLESVGVVAWDYIGVNLKPGVNALSVSGMDSFGNVRGEAVVTVRVPGKLAKLVISVPREVNADGQTPVGIKVELLDSEGLRVTNRTAVTLESTRGQWQVMDLDPQEPGIQTFIEGGVATLALLPPSDPGKASLRLSSGGLQAQADVLFVPHLRPLIAAGLIEGVLNLRNLNPNALVPSRSGDVFEREIQTASQNFNDGKGSGAARASLFLKGKVLGSTLLTLSYDSDKPKDTALFRDIQPDQFYPVYGDSSVKGFDAQSTSKLYVRVDQGSSFALYGDFSTQTDNPARVLSQYSRSFNGIKGRYDSNGLMVDGFASYTNLTQVIDEIAANGTSGPYRLSRVNGVINSQRVDVVTRDRNQPTLVIASAPLAQFTDYAVEAVSGKILFKAPIASLDSNLNPVYIRVTYEISAGGPSFWVAGIDARQTLADNVTVGGTYIKDTNPANVQSLLGGNFTWAVGPKTSVVGEIAQSRSDLLGAGVARRLELKHEDADLQFRAYGVQTDPNFSNASSTFNAGASEFGAKLGYRLNEKTRLVGEAIKSRASGNLAQFPGSIALAPTVVDALQPNIGAVNGATRAAESIGIERSLPLDLKLTVSLRRVDGNALPTQPLASGAVPNNYTSARIRLDAPVPGVSQATVFAQYEQALDDNNRSATTVGGTYQLAPQTKLYAVHQTSNSLTGDYGLNPNQQNYATVAGIDTTYMQGGQVFSEYRVGDSIDGRSARAAIGLRNLWSLAPGLSLNTGVQQIHPVAGVVTDKSTALTGAIEYIANPTWKGSARLEWSRATTTQTWLATLGTAAKINDDFTALGRIAYNTQTSDAPAAGSIHLRQAQLGVAYRPVASNAFNALARLEFKRSQNSTLGQGMNIDESANIFSTHLNYQPSANIAVNGRYGVKWAADYSQGLTSTYTSQLIGARATLDISSRWDAGVQYFVNLGGKGLSVYQQALGFEVGYLLKKNLWVSGGFNIKGFSDPDLAGEDFTQRGAYVRLRFKFDETLFESNNSGKTELPAMMQSRESQY